MNKLKFDVAVLDRQETGKIESVIELYVCQEIQDTYGQHTLMVRFSVAKLDEEYLLTYEITGNVEVACTRCTEIFAYPIAISDAQAYEVATTDEIDLDEEFRQALLLAMVQYPVCAEECKGLCAVCGKNRNSEPCSCDDTLKDPRWHTLKDLL